MEIVRQRSCVPVSACHNLSVISPPGYAACDCCLSAALVRGRPGGRILAQVAADLSVPPLRFCSHFKFCAGRPRVIWPYPVCSFLLHRGTRLAWPATRAGGSQLVRVHYDCPSVFPVCVLVRRCQARSCLFQNLAPTAAVLCLLRPFWIGLAWPVRWTSTQVREHFQSSTPQSMAANGQPLPLLDPLPPLPPQRPRLQHLPQDPG